jgi:hypothetical protein
MGNALHTESDPTSPQYTEAELAAHARLISLATRSYERCNRRRAARSADSWAAIANLLWDAMQDAGLVLLPRDSQRRRFVRDRYQDAENRRVALRDRQANDADRLGLN